MFVFHCAEPSDSGLPGVFFLAFESTYIFSPVVPEYRVTSVDVVDLII